LLSLLWSKLQTSVHCPKMFSERGSKASGFFVLNHNAIIIPHKVNSNYLVLFTLFSQCSFPNLLKNAVHSFSFFQI
jgi:hypothetical protein